MVQYFTPADSQKALANAATLDEVANGNVGQTVISPDGREYPTLAEAMNRIQQITNDADATAQQKLDALQALYNNADATTQAEIANLQQSINIAAAAGAGENGWTALVVQDASGMTQQQVNDKTAIFYNTVADMVADTKLKAGKAVITHGYYAPNDGGGARYLIKDTATDYSIPVANNLHAVFADSFDIRKFGIRNSATLDQTTEIQRMVNYADSRVYEIDFLNYSLQVPKTIVPYRAANNGQGMMFRKVHKLKNLTISNDKNQTLQQGYCCIWFLPQADGVGIFELDNITFDPFVANYNITAGDGDGHMHGFTAEWAKDFPISWPQNQQFMTGYSIVYNNINFVSPAVSYNLATNLWCREIRATNITGEYWGLYIWHWCDRLYAENVHGVFRDDLHTAANPQRTLVTNLFQEEQEVGDSNFAYTQTCQEFRNISCIKKSDGSIYASIVRQGMGKPYLKEFIADNVKGNIKWYMGQPTELDTRYSIGKAAITNCDDGKKGITFWCAIDNLMIKNSKTFYLISSYKYLINYAYLENVEFYGNVGVFADCTINKLVSINCKFYETVYGFNYPGVCVIKEIYIVNPDIKIPTQARFLTCAFNKLVIQGGKLEAGTGSYFSLFITNINSPDTNAKATVNISGLTSFIGGGDGNNLVFCESEKSADVTVTNNNFKGKPNFVLNGGSLVYENNTPFVQRSVPLDLPSLATAAQQSSVVYVGGAKLGDTTIASLDKPLQGTRLWAEVTSDNNVTVYHRNDTGATVDLPSGTLTVKIV